MSSEEKPKGLWHRLITVVGVSIPSRFRQDWRQEWQAELSFREAQLAEWHKLDSRAKLNLFRHSTGAFMDALWFQRRRWEDAMIQDLRFGVRMLLKDKSFTAVAILSIALGIGANTAIFQLLDAVRLQTLPVKAPNELVEVRLTDMKGARGGFAKTYPTVNNPIWEQIRDRQQAFSGIFAWGTDSVNLNPGGEVRRAQMLYVSGDFFRTLGVNAARGQLIAKEDDQPGCGAPGLVISHSFWQREFGGSDSVVGQKFTLSNRPFEIIGVTPANFFGMEVGKSFDLALPICAGPLVRGNDRMLGGTIWWLIVTGRLKPDWSPEQANAHVQSISAPVFEAALPPNYPPASVQDYLSSTLTTVPAGAGVSQLREDYERPLWLLLAIAGLVLLIACANLANLLLARASAREREIAVRHALGASRGRLVRQMLIESLLLAVAGAALGAWLAQVLSKYLVAYLSTTNNPIFLDLGPNWRVLGFAAGLAIVTCLLFGLVPAMRATRGNAAKVMNSSGRANTASRERFSLRRALVVAQVAMSMVLVAGAILFSRSLNRLLTVETGFQHEGVIAADINFTRLNLAQENLQPFKDDLLGRVRAIPGVESASVTHEVPLKGWGGGRVWMDGTSAEEGKDINFSRIGTDYFKTLQIPLRAGREIQANDRAGAPKVAVVNEAFARRLLNGANPVGQRFRVAASPGVSETAYEIVGLVADTKYEDLREAYQPIAYTAAAQDPRAGHGIQVLMRSRLKAGEATAAVKNVLNEVNPLITVSFEGLEPLIEATVLRERLMATLSNLFGALALLLASIGLYGILSYGVASRTKELGIRMALGAGRTNVLWLILREGLWLVIVGVVVGLPIIFAVTRLGEALLFGLSPTDPVSIILASLLLLTVAVLAGYIPARRATRVDPLVALRYE